jgi:hypothetical protein
LKKLESLAQKAVESDDGHLPARLVLTLAHMGSGHADEALAEARAGPPDRSGRLSALAATALAVHSDRPGAEAELVKAERQLQRPNRTDLIRPYLALGLVDRAKSIIQEALAQNNANLLALLVDPQMAGLDREGVLDPVRSRLRN